MHALPETFAVEDTKARIRQGKATCFDLLQALVREKQAKNPDEDYRSALLWLEAIRKR